MLPAIFTSTTLHVVPQESLLHEDDENSWLDPAAVMLYLQCPFSYVSQPWLTRKAQEATKEYIQWSRRVVLTPPSLCEWKRVISLIKSGIHPDISNGCFGRKIIASEVCGTAGLHFCLRRIWIRNQITGASNGEFGVIVEYQHDQNSSNWRSNLLNRDGCIVIPGLLDCPSDFVIRCHAFSAVIYPWLGSDWDHECREGENST
jgi:hypothetical protein